MTDTFLKKIKKAVRVTAILTVVAALAVLMLFLSIYSGELSVTQLPWNKAKAKNIIKRHLRNDLSINVMYIKEGICTSSSSIEAEQMMSIYDDRYVFNMTYGNYDPNYPKYWRELVLAPNFSIIQDDFAETYITDFMNNKINNEIEQKISPAKINIGLGITLYDPNSHFKYSECFTPTTPDKAIFYELNKKCTYAAFLTELDYNGRDKADVWWDIFLYLHEKELNPTSINYKDEKRYLPELDFNKSKEENIEKIKNWIKNSTQF